MKNTLEQRTGRIAVIIGVMWLIACAVMAVAGLFDFSVALALAFRGVLVVMGLAALALLGGFVFGRGAPRSNRRGS